MAYSFLFPSYLSSSPLVLIIQHYEEKCCHRDVTMLARNARFRSYILKFRTNSRPYTYYICSTFCRAVAYFAVPRLRSGDSSSRSFWLNREAPCGEVIYSILRSGRAPLGVGDLHHFQVGSYPLGGLVTWKCSFFKRDFSPKAILASPRGRSGIFGGRGASLSLQQIFFGCLLLPLR